MFWSIRPEDAQYGLARVSGVGSLGMNVRSAGKVDLEVVLHLIPKPEQESDEDDDFQDDKLDLSQPVAELGDAVGLASVHKISTSPDWWRSCAFCR